MSLRPIAPTYPTRTIVWPGSSCSSVKLKFIEYGLVKFFGVVLRLKPNGSNCLKSMFVAPGPGGVYGNGFATENPDEISRKGFGNDGENVVVGVDAVVTPWLFRPNGAMPKS